VPLSTVDSFVGSECTAAVRRRLALERELGLARRFHLRDPGLDHPHRCLEAAVHLTGHRLHDPALEVADAALQLLVDATQALLERRLERREARGKGLHLAPKGQAGRLELRPDRLDVRPRSGQPLDVLSQVLERPGNLLPECAERLAKPDAEPLQVAHGLGAQPADRAVELGGDPSEAFPDPVAVRDDRLAGALEALDERALLAQDLLLRLDELLEDLRLLPIGTFAQ